MPDQTKAIVDFITVFISQVPDEQHRKQLEYALARTQALMSHDEPALAALTPPYIPKHIS